MANMIWACMLWSLILLLLMKSLPLNIIFIGYVLSCLIGMGVHFGLAAIAFRCLVITGYLAVGIQYRREVKKCNKNTVIEAAKMMKIYK